MSGQLFEQKILIENFYSSWKRKPFRILLASSEFTIEVGIILAHVVSSNNTLRLVRQLLSWKQKRNWFKIWNFFWQIQLELKENHCKYLEFVRHPSIWSVDIYSHHIVYNTKRLIIFKLHWTICSTKVIINRHVLLLA